MPDAFTIREGLNFSFRCRNFWMRRILAFGVAEVVVDKRSCLVSRVTSNDLNQVNAGCPACVFTDAISSAFYARGANSRQANVGEGNASLRLMAPITECYRSVVRCWNSERITLDLYRKRPGGKGRADNGRLECRAASDRVVRRKRLARRAVTRDLWGLNADVRTAVKGASDGLRS